jgi:predicted nucleotidyltransferase
MAQQSSAGVEPAPNSDGDPALDEVVRRLVAALNPERIYVFGSRARGDAGADSDYDVMVVVSRAGERPYALEHRAYHALRGLTTPVDIVVVTRDQFERRRAVVASLPATVEREGRLLYAA